jgi:hypothetical protein
MSKSKNRLIEFLIDIRHNDYDREFLSFNATNLIMQEGAINYDINLNDKITLMILDFFIKLDTHFINQDLLREVIDDLIEMFSRENDPEEIQILFILYKDEITQLYKKYSENRINIQSLRSALRRYCNRKDDFDKLIDLARLAY